MLHVSRDNGRGIQVKLLNSVVRAEREQAGTWTVHREAPDMLEGWDTVVGNMLCPDIPR